MPDRLRAFKVDENLPEDVAAAFLQAGYEASTVTNQGLAGVEDARLSEAVRQEGRVLVTLDVDFGDVRAYPPHEYPGIIVLRVTRQDKLRILAAIGRILPLLSTEAVARRLWIVEEKDRVALVRELSVNLRQPAPTRTSRARYNLQFPMGPVGRVWRPSRPALPS